MLLLRNILVTLALGMVCGCSGPEYCDDCRVLAAAAPEHKASQKEVHDKKTQTRIYYYSRISDGIPDDYVTKCPCYCHAYVRDQLKK